MGRYSGESLRDSLERLVGTTAARTVCLCLRGEAANSPGSGLSWVSSRTYPVGCTLQTRCVFQV
jgi:hypothetical protein